MPIDLSTIFDAAAKLGALGLSLIGIFALATGRVRVGSLVDAEKADDKAETVNRLQEVKNERDEWRALAQTTASELKRLNDLLDTAIKFLLDPTRRPSA